MKFIYKLTLASFLLLAACNDNYLEVLPEDEISKENFFKSDGDFHTYALGLYDFTGYGVGNASNIPVDSDETVGGNQSQNSRIFDRRTVPESGGQWSWSRLRSINIMIEAAQQAELEEEVKQHWEGVGRLFRAREYFSKVRLFGNVPWVDHELGTDSPELYASQDNRETVMAHVLEDLDFAIDHIRSSRDENLINRDVALAIKSEICLFEGTFRKYHTELGLNDSEAWLRESITASETLMEEGQYSLSPDYQDIYSSVDLAGNPEIILYKHYELGVIVNTQVRTLGLSNRIGVTKDAVEAFLCADGLPYGISPLHPDAQEGRPELPKDEFRDRDPRMAKILVVPYDETTGPQNAPAIFNTSTNDLPTYAPAYLGEDGIPSPTGYGIYKWWNPESPVDDVNGILDAPLYTYNRILLNFAEAKAELGEADNAVLDRSINLLRQRAAMPDLTTEFADSFNDPNKAVDAPEISNLLWEIRRERRVELLLEGSRLDDILRWKKASYFGKPFVGAYVDLDNRPFSAYNEDGTNKSSVILGDRAGNRLPAAARTGYVLPYLERQPEWTDDDLKLYYSPIDTRSLTINPQLEQVPGW